MKTVLKIFLAVALGIGLVASAQAVTITTAQNATGYASDILSTDLLQSAATLSSSTGTFTQEKVVGTSALTDGGFGALGGQGAQPVGTYLNAASAGLGEELVYTLSGSTYGYNLSSIATYTGWDSGRFAQGYDVYVHKIGAAVGSYAKLASVSYAPGAISTGGLKENAKVVVTTAMGTLASTGTLASGVDQIKFVFQNQTNGWQGYRELDVVGTAASAATSLTNGSFESPGIGTGEGAYQEGVTASGWTLIPGLLKVINTNNNTGGGGIVGNGSAYGNVNAPDGTQAGLLKGAGGMEQIVGGFEAGKQYAISFYSAGRAGAGPNPFEVLLDGTALTFSGSTTITPTNNVYNLYSSTFAATGNTMTLTFLSTLTTAVDLSSYVDNVQIAQIPEPGTMILFITGMFGLLAFVWRKQTVWNVLARWSFLAFVPIGAGIAMSAVGVAQATTISYDSTSGSSFAVSNSDLLQATGTALDFVGSYNTDTYEGCGTTAVLTNGDFGSNGTSAPGHINEEGVWVSDGNASHPDTCAIYNGAIATYTFDTSANTAGYNVTNINIYSSWSDEGRDAMNVTVAYSTMAAPGTYTDIVTASGDPGLCNAAYITTDLTGVKSIRFSFGDQENGFAGYNELDVVGTPVPEPSTMILALLGAISLLAYAWRRR